MEALPAVSSFNDDRPGEVDEALRVSSKNLYKTLNPEGKSELCIDELLKNLTEVYDKKGDRKKSLVENSVRKLLRSKGGKGFNEDDLEKLNRRFVSGKLPRLKSSAQVRITPAKGHGNQTNEIQNGGLKKVILGHAISSASYVWHRAEKAVSRTGREWMWTLVPTGQINTLLSFLLFSYVIKVSFLTWFLPLALLSVSSLIMVISTIRLVRGKKRFREFKAWGEFLDLVSTTEEKSIDTSRAEEAYILKHLSPMIHFFLASAGCIMGFGTSEKSWVFTSELAILSLLMYGTVVYIFNYYSKKQSRNILILQICSSVFRGFSCSDASEVFGLLVTLPVPFIGVDVNISPSSIFRIIMYMKLFSLALIGKDNAKFSFHVLKKVLPLAVAIVWWDVGDSFYCESSMYSIIRATFEYVSILFAMPLFSIFVVYAIISSLLSMEISHVGIGLAIVGITSLYFIFARNSTSIRNRYEALIEKSSLKRVLSIGMFLVFGYIMLYYRPSGLGVPNSGITWEDYRNTCVESKSQLIGNNIENAVACYEFQGVGVTWKGQVENVAVTQIENKFDDLLDLMPHSVAMWLSCKYGDSNLPVLECSNTNELSPLQHAHCSLRNIRKCSIHNHNIYTFRVTVKMPSSVPDNSSHFISLDASHEFKNLVFNLSRGTDIKFSGYLTGEKGTLLTKVLWSETDDDHMIKVEKRKQRIGSHLDDMLSQALTALHNFIFYPIISFDHSDA